MLVIRPKAVALAMGICVSAGRLGTWLTFVLNPFIIRRTNGNWRAALWIAASWGIMGFVAAIVYILLDKFAVRQRRIKKGIQLSINEDDSGPAERVHLGIVKTFPASYWLICVLVTLYYAVVFPFESTATQLLSERYHYSEENAGRIISLLPLTSMLLSPVFGYGIDKIGRRPLLVLLGQVGLLLAMVSMALTHINPIPPVLLVGLVFSLVPAALWPCIPIVITGNFATAFGLMTSIMNFGLLVTYYSQGLVTDLFKGNTEYSLLFYSLLCAIGLLIAFLWVMLDIRLGGQCSKKNAPVPQH